jgi:hypothetical protein
MSANVIPAELLRKMEDIISGYISRNWGAISEDCRMPKMDELTHEIVSLVSKHQCHAR